MTTAPLDLDRLRHFPWLAEVEHHAQIDSTNNRAKQRLEAAQADSSSLPLPLLIVADRQTAGRGRGARTWWTGAGSLAMSLVLDSSEWGLDPRQRTGVSLAAAVAVVDALHAAAPDLARIVEPHEAGIHWPNDVFVAGRKLAGILIEAFDRERVVIGIGVNTNNSLAQAPDEIRQVAVTLRDLTDRCCDPTDFLLTLLQKLQDAIAALSAGRPELGARFRTLCLQRGRLLTLQHGNERVQGRCYDVAPDGGLILDTATGRRAFYSGMLIHD